MLCSFNHFCGGVFWDGGVVTQDEVQSLLEREEEVRGAYVHKTLLKDPNGNLTLWGDFYQIERGCL